LQPGELGPCLWRLGRGLSRWARHSWTLNFTWALEKSLKKYTATKYEVGQCGSLVQHQPGMCQALSLVPSIAKTNSKKKYTRRLTNIRTPSGLGD
jgi:hypothetical protein